ncbi:hypothetical protein [Paenibacillus sp. NPDC058174]|uniref:hypothetical protein n=1 Tax=Paenibacillus sp. NPDC058174 TaxID=3346366 RepID=UPI0036DC2E24
MNTTKRKNKKGVVATSAVLLAIMLTASACASGNTDKPNQNNQSNQNQVTEQPSDATPTPDSESNETTENGSSNGNNNNGVNETGTGSPDTPATDKGSNSPDNSAAIAKEGVYGGQVDTTSIEVTVDGNPLVLQITDAFTDTLNKLKPDDKIKIEYTEKNIDGMTLLYLSKLEKL